jgi:glycine cleavage system regulatory protein
MKPKLILSAVGSDRPGLTQRLAEAVYAAGGNWLESHLSRLGGKYVGSVLVEIEAERMAELQAAIEGVDSAGLHVTIVPAGDREPETGERLRIELVGQDRPGIVREVTTVLAGLGVNIEDFDSRPEMSSMSGQRLFAAAARLSLPAGVSAESVRDALEAISGEIMVDFVIGDPA